MLSPELDSPPGWGPSFRKKKKRYIVRRIPSGGTRTLPQGCTVVSRGLLPYFCFPPPLLPNSLNLLENSAKVKAVGGSLFPTNERDVCAQESHRVLLSFFLFLCSLGLRPWHMEVPRPGAESELQLPAYTTATAMPGPSSICDLHHSSQQHWLPHPLSEARDRTLILKDPSQVH